MQSYEYYGHKKDLLTKEIERLTGSLKLQWLVLDTKQSISMMKVDICEVCGTESYYCFDDSSDGRFYWNDDWHCMVCAWSNKRMGWGHFDTFFDKWLDHIYWRRLYGDV